MATLNFEMSGGAGIPLRVNTKPFFLAGSLALASLVLTLTLRAGAQPAAVAAQEAKHFETKITIAAKVDYLLSLPADYGKTRRPWPLVPFLHGAGQQGNELSRAKTAG